MEKNLGSQGWPEDYPACRLTTVRAVPRVQTGKFRRQPVWGWEQAVLVPSAPFLDPWNIFHLQHTSPKLPEAGASLAVASA